MTEAVGGAGRSALRVGAVVEAAIGGYTRSFGALLPMAAAASLPRILDSLLGGRGIATTLALGLGGGLLACAMTIPACLVADAALQKQPPLSLGETFGRSGPASRRFIRWALATTPAFAGIVLVVVGGVAAAVFSNRLLGRAVGLAAWILVAAAAILAFRLLILWSLLGPVVAFEPAGEGSRPLFRSAQLIRPQFWRAACSWMALWVFGAPEAYLGYVGTNPQTHQITDRAVYWLGTAWGVLSLPLLWTGMVAIYRGLRGASGTGA